MIVGAFSKQLKQGLTGAALTVTLLVAAGCTDGYPRDLAYPARADLLVTSAPKEELTYPDSPGELDRSIAQIKSRGGQTLNPKDVPADQKKDLIQELNKVFGSPGSPKVSSADEETKEAVSDLKLDLKTLAGGGQLYRRHCLHCHGLTGDGRGPSGPWLNPHPRDYRQGQFKFMSSDPEKLGESRKPGRTDIRRVLMNGIEGTSMPAFNTLEESQLEALVSYVIHLSIRGEVEFNTLQTILAKRELEGDEEDEERTVASHVKKWTKNYVQRWKIANTDETQIKPQKAPPYTDQEWQDSVVSGYRLFTDPKGDASCIKCHTDFGRQVNFRYDNWGTLVRPANLTVSVYRGGRRPIDLFWRIKGGIVPSGMPATGLKDHKDIWDVVNFLQALPHPRMLPLSIRKDIYVREQQVASQ